MAISDIGKTMSLYAQPTEFDQNAWKSAFDMANAFADTSEKHRRNRENLATEDWRVAFQNNEYQTGIGTNNVNLADLQRQYNNALLIDPSANQEAIAQNNYLTTSAETGRQNLLGQTELLQALQSYGLNPDGTARTLPEAYSAMVADGKNLQNPHAFSPVWQAGNQERANRQALYQGIIDNSMETTFDPLGNVIKTGKISAQSLDQNLNLAIVKGAITKAEADEIRHRAFPVVPNQAVTPAGGFTSSLGSLLAVPVNNVQIPYKRGGVPVVAQPVVTAEQAASQNAPLTPAQKQQLLVDNLKHWENGGAVDYWNDYWQKLRLEEKAKSNAMAQVMQMNSPILPYYLQR